MPNTDHLMGYAPAMREDFREPEAWECYLRFPLGTPARMRGLWEAVECEASGSWRPEARHVTGASSMCMTRGDVVGLQAQEGPLPARGEPDEPEVMVTVPNDAGVVFTVDLVRRPVETLRDEPRTLSPAAEWPFAGQGWRNGDGGLGAQCERVRLEKLKAAEQQWLAAEEQRKRDAITACYADKVRA